jgi:hypothetical protein
MESHRAKVSEIMRFRAYVTKIIYIYIYEKPTCHHLFVIIFVTERNLIVVSKRLHTTPYTHTGHVNAICIVLFCC